MKHLPILLALLLPLALFAQGRRSFTADSLAFVNAPWQVDTFDGVKFYSHHFNQRQLFNSNQYFSVIEVPRGHHRLALVADTLLTTVSDFALRNKALAAINGSYFNMRTGEPVCFLRIAGQQLGENTPPRTGPDSLRKYYQYATIRVLPSGRPRFLVPDSLRTAESLLPDSNLMTAGPMLLQRGSTVPQRTEKRFVSGRHNRTAIGLKPDGTVLLLVVDGRAKGLSEGLSLPELTLVMRWLGCCDAVNLDGGGSSTMYVRNHGDEGIVNHPSDNGRFDPQGQRPVANAILVL